MKIYFPIYFTNKKYVEIESGNISKIIIFPVDASAEFRSHKNIYNLSRIRDKLKL
jgi:hypothetical protein